MTSTAYGTCSECHRPRTPGAIFCECGALLDYSASGAGRAHDEPTAPGAGRAHDEPTAPVVARAADFEWPPGPYHATHEPAVLSTSALRVVHCPNDKCKALNPARLLFCWRCDTPMIQGEEAGEPWRWRRVLRLEKPPLRAGERQRPRGPFISKDPRTLVRAGLIVLGLLVVLGALVIGAIKGWDAADKHASRWFGSAREALFPRFDPMSPSSVNPPRKKKDGKEIPHPAADAFDSNLSTYWQSTTPRQVWDRIRVNFKPAAKEINEVAVFAGDPTAKTIVPRSLQMTFYRWEPHPELHPDQCKVSRHLPPFPPLREQGAFCVTGIAQQFPLVNTPSEQRFSTGTQRDIGQVVITIRGVHRTDNPKAKAALTDIEFFNKH
jgi:hypothetical protein